MLPHGESQAHGGRRHIKSDPDDSLVDEDILRVIRSADKSSTPYTDATQVSQKYGLQICWCSLHM